MSSLLKIVFPQHLKKKLSEIYSKKQRKNHIQTMKDAPIVCQDQCIEHQEVIRILSHGIIIDGEEFYEKCKLEKSFQELTENDKIRLRSQMMIIEKFIGNLKGARNISNCTSQYLMMRGQRKLKIPTNWRSEKANEVIEAFNR